MRSKLIRDMGKYLTDQQVTKVANMYGLDFAHLKAIIEVETNGTGFYKASKLFDTLVPVIRLENHKFSDYTDHQYDQRYPHISSKVFNNKYNVAGIGEFNRFDEAYQLDGKAAVNASSWGLGQIMGINWELCRYKSLNEFLNAAFNSEQSQLDMMCRFIKHNNNGILIDALKSQDWATFALNYNGKNYSQNQYNIKLEQAYKKWAS